MAFEMVVSIGMGCDFGGKRWYRLGFKPINVDFTMGEGLLVHLREFSQSEILCALYLSD